MKIKTIASFKPDQFSDWIEVGEIFEARRMTAGLFDHETPFQIIDGKHSGKFIPYKFAVELPKERTYSESEYTAVHQELLQRREEVAELMRERDALLQTIERTGSEQNPVVLPREVAEALEKAKKWADNVELIAWWIPHEESKDGYWKILHDYGDLQGGFFKLVDALRYGYAIEDPHAEKRAQLLENLAKIGYEEETAQTIVDTIAPIIFGTEMQKSG